MHVDLTRPERLYRYSERKWLERALLHGEFRLRPAAEYIDAQIGSARQDDELVRVRTSPGENVQIFVPGRVEPLRPLGDVTYTSTVGTNYLVLCFSSCWDELLFKDFVPSDSCLIVHNVTEFAERLHAAVEAQLPAWAGIDASVVYGGNGPWGAVFSKPTRFIAQHEWRFAWRPPSVTKELTPLLVSIGSIERIAEIVDAPPSRSGGAQPFVAPEVLQQASPASAGG